MKQKQGAIKQEGALKYISLIAKIIFKNLIELWKIK